MGFNMNDLFANYQNQQLYKKYNTTAKQKKATEDELKQLDVNNDGVVNSKDSTQMKNDEKEILKTTDLFDINGDNQINAKDFIMITQGVDFNQNGKIDNEEKAFLKNYQSKIINEVLKNIKADNTLTITDLINFEAELANVSDADKKTYKSYLSQIETQMLTNIKKNLDLNKDNKNTADDLKALWKTTYNLDENTKLTNGSTLKSIINGIEDKMITAIMKSDKSVTKSNLNILKKDCIAQLNKNEGLYDEEIPSSNPITPASNNKIQGTEYLLSSDESFIINVNGKEIKVKPTVDHRSKYAEEEHAKIIVSDDGKINIYATGRLTQLWFDTNEDLDIVVQESNNENFKLRSGKGNDNIVVADGVKMGMISAGDGNDNIVINNATTGQVWGDAGDDNITVKKGTVNGTLFGGDGNDTISNFGTVSGISGGKGNDIITNEATGHSGYIYGEDGNDFITNNGVIGLNSWLGDISGGKGNDTIINNGIAYDISGEAGDDIIENNGIAGRLAGGSGKDILRAEGQHSDDIFPSNFENINQRLKKNITLNDFIDQHNTKNDEANKIRKEIDNIDKVKQHNILEELWEWLCRIFKSHKI